LISNEFLASFERYIKENHQVDLFHQNKIEFRKSSSTLLLQLADLIGGSINRYEARKSLLNPFDILQGKCTARISWPEAYQHFTVDEAEEPDEFRDVISELALLRINGYIDKNMGDRKRAFAYALCSFLTCALFFCTIPKPDPSILLKS
jgi:hypothetical protein